MNFGVKCRTGVLPRGRVCHSRKIAAQRRTVHVAFRLDSSAVRASVSGLASSFSRSVDRTQGP